jgi:hypothetical protein
VYTFLSAQLTSETSYNAKDGTVARETKSCWKLLGAVSALENKPQEALDATSQDEKHIYIRFEHQLLTIRPKN